MFVTDCISLVFVRRPPEGLQNIYDWINEEYECGRNIPTVILRVKYLLLDSETLILCTGFPDSFIHLS